MKTILAATALTLSLGAPAFADPMAAAIAHFNQDRSPNERIALPEAGGTVTVSTRSGATDRAIAVFNGSADRPSDMILGGTPWNGTPRYAADIFEALRAESDD
jgi:hypothetical protein